MTVKEMRDGLETIMNEWNKAWLRDKQNHGFETPARDAYEIEMTKEMYNFCEEAVKFIDNIHRTGISKDYGWPNNLLYDIDIDPATISDKSGKGFERAFASLDEKEQTTLLMLYKDRMTQRAAGEKLGVSGTRIQELKNRSLRKLRIGRNQKLIIYGQEAIDELQAVKDTLEMEKKFLQLQIDEIRHKSDAIQKILTVTFENSEFSDIPEIKELVNKHFTDWNRPIEELNLSTRAYHILSRNGYHKISDLATLRLSTLKKFRNAGAGTIKEIVERCAEHGITIT